MDAPMRSLATLHDVVEDLSERGEQPALIAFRPSGREQWSFAELHDRVRRLAGGLRAAGLLPGDVAALLAPNGPEWVAACLAAVDAGVVVAPLDATVDDAHLERLLRAASPHVLFTTRDRAGRAALAALDRPPLVVLLDAEAGDERSWLRLSSSEPPMPCRPDPTATAALFHTSGTTGEPKGVPLTHANLTANLSALLEQRLVGPGDRLLLPLPLHHTYPFTVGLLTAMASGAALVFPASLRGPDVVAALRDAGATAILAVPRFYEALLTAVDARVGARGRWARGLFRWALASSTAIRRRVGLRVGRAIFAPLRRQFAPRVRIVASGGAALDPALAWKLEGLGFDVVTGYGLTETSPILTIGSGRTTGFDSAGRAIRGVEIRIGEPDASGAGEVLARGPSVFSGYRDDPAKTAEAFTRDGWFRTGDLGFLDRAGRLHLAGRATERIALPDGKKIQPEELEAAFRSGSGITEIAVLEVDSRLVALVAAPPMPGESAESRAARVRAAVVEWSAALPAHQRVLDHGIVAEPLPRTPLGKLRRHLLPELFRSAKADERPPIGAAASVAIAPEDRRLLDDPKAAAVLEWLESRFGKARVRLDASLRLDLGVDSLEWVSLTLELSDRLGVDLDEASIARIDTVRDLVRAACAAEGARRPSPLEAPEAALDESHRRWLEPMGPALSLASAALLRLHRVLFRLCFRMRVVGLERLPAREPFVVSPNHVSDLDPFAVAAALPWRILRNTYWGGATDRLFTNGATRLLSRLARVVPVDPEGALLSSLALGAAVLGRGHDLVWFPEGRRSLSGRLERFHPGVGLLALRFGVPVVPVFIDGTLEALPRDRRIPRLRRITVVFGEPLDSRAHSSAGAEGAEAIASALQDAVRRLGDAPAVS
jgi:long-chain acyl-CoA synthetase